MATGRPRTAYFLRARIIEKDGTRTAPPRGFWDDLHRQVSSLAYVERGARYRGRDYRGSARQEPTLSQDYLYLGKVRTVADFPDATSAPGADDPDVLEVDGDLLEPLYVRWLGAGDVGVFLRSTGGPSFAAFGAWVTQVLRMDTTGRSFELTPVVRDDALRRLRDAEGATKIHFKFEPDALTAEGAVSEGDGTLAGSLASIQDLANGEVSVEVGLSFGHARPTEESARAMAKQVRELVGRPGLRSMSATLLTPNVEGDLVRDKIDFIRDRITHKVDVGDSQDQSPTPAAVLMAMNEAILKYREPAVVE